MNRHIRVFHIWIALALLLVSAAATGGAHDGKAAAGGHQHHHSMTAEQLAELRAKIPLYREYSDEAIAAGMSRMKNSWGWVTETPAGARVGVLALAHGFKETGNRQFAEAYAGAANDYPKAYAFGMAMMTSEHIQSAIDALQDNGAEIIVVVPTTTADNTTLVRQWDYIFGKRDESAYLDVARVRSDAELIWAPTPTGDPLVAEIMLDYARELSRDPSRELVIIMGHGPQDSADNERELEILNRHAAFIRKQGGFSEVRAANVQDDAPTGVRAANVEMIRGWAESARAEGRQAIVVHTALTQSGVVGRMARDVEGVAEFNSKGLMQHPLFGQWIDNAIARTLASAQ